MAIWTINKINGDQIGSCNSANTADEAITKFKAAWPCYTTLADQLRAVRMREIYVNGGYCIIPAVEA